MFASRTMTSVRGFARGNGAAGITSKEPISLDRIREVAPSIFAEHEHDSRSDRYTFIPTSDIVKYLMEQGFGIYAVNQSGARDATKRAFTKHMIRFRRMGQTFIVGEVFPEIVLVNGHDGSSAYCLMGGLFRPVCTNGMVVSEGVISDVRVHHKGKILEDVAEGVENVARQLPNLAKNIEDMRLIELTPNEQGVFARAALAVKYDDHPPINESQALAIRRPEDAKPTLWNTFNRLQETIIKGGDRYRLETERGIQRRRTQPTNSVDGQTRLNRALWQMAEEMKAIKTGATIPQGQGSPAL